MSTPPEETPIDWEAVENAGLRGLYGSEPETPSPKPAHTPVPWELLPPSQYQNVTRIFAGSTYLVIIGNSDHTEEQTLANAKHIVRCVNLMPKMVEALGTALEWFTPGIKMSPLADSIRAILSEAEPHQEVSECVWEECHYQSGEWDACGGVRMFSTDGFERGFKFCPYCGKPVRFSEAEAEPKN